jgi:hypothetical protein
VTGSLSFQYDQWSWSISHTYIDSDDRTPYDDDSQLYEGQIRADAYVGEYSVGTGLQLSTTDYTQVADPTNITVSFNVGGPVWRDRVYFNGDLSYTVDTDSADSVDSNNLISNATIDWIAIQPENNLPGLTLSALGSYQGREDHVQHSEQNAFQLYLRATLSWPVLWGKM